MPAYNTQKNKQNSKAKINKKGGGTVQEEEEYKVDFEGENQISEYITYLSNTYWEEIENVPRYLQNDEHAKEIVKTFAIIQDAMYGYNYLPKEVPQQINESHTDDLLELYLSSKFGNTHDIMHDAWALARLISLDTSSEVWKWKKFQEGVEGGVKKLQNIENPSESKTGVEIDLSHFGFGDIGTAQVQERRLLQFVFYEELQRNEKVKDDVPTGTYDLVDSKYSLSNFLDHSKNNNSTGGGRSKAKSKSNTKATSVSTKNSRKHNSK